MVGVVSFSRSQLLLRSPSRSERSFTNNLGKNLRKKRPKSEFGLHICCNAKGRMYCSALFSSGLNPNEELESRIPISIPSRSFEKGHVRLSISRPQLPSSLNIRHQFLFESRIRVAAGSQGGLSDEDDDLCPVDCVREFKTDEDFLKILDRAKETGALVVVDFYRTSCGSCKYIEQGFAKLCKGSGDEETPVIFLKHNVIDEYDEQSEVAERLRIRTVPLFHFYKDGVLLEAFPTRDKERILAAISKYSSSALQI